MKSVSTFILTVLLFSFSAVAQSKLTTNTLKLDEGQKGEKATINDLKWLSGTWQGAALGGTSEEIYSAPQAGAMMGMYRLIIDGKTIFYELITILEQNATLHLRLKHFNPDLVGWEEKAQTVDFPYVKKEGKRFYFQGMTFESVGPKKVNVYVAMRQKDGTYKEEVFRYARK